MNLKSLTASRRLKGGSNNLIAAIIAVVVIVVIAAIVAFFVLFKGPSSTTSGAAKNLVKFFPANTVFYMEMDVTEDNFKKLQQFSGDSFNIDQLFKGIQYSAEHPQQAMKAFEVINDIKNTIEPKVAMGIWASEETPEKPDKVIIAAAVKDETKIPEIMDKFSDGKVEFEVKDIDGKSFHVSTGAPKTGAYIVYKNILLFSDNPDTINLAIKNFDSNAENVLSTKEAKDIIANLPSERLITGLFNLTTLHKVAEKQAGGENTKTQQLEKIIKTMTHTGLAVTLHGKVLEVSSYTPYNLDTLEDEDLKAHLVKVLSSTNSLEAPKVLSNTNVGFVSIAGLSQIFNTMLLFMNDNELQGYQMTKMQTSMMTKLDLDKDIIPLFSEEFTLGVAQKKNTEPLPTLILSKKDNTVQVFSKLLSALPFAPKEASYEGVSYTETTVPGQGGAPMTVGYCPLDNVVVLGEKESLESSINSSKNVGDSLANTDIYKSMSSLIPKNPMFVIYINTNKLANDMKSVVKENSQQAEQLKEINKVYDGMILSIANNKEKALVGSLLLKGKE